MNITGNATSRQYVDPPPRALRGWPGCDYPRPLPAPGQYAAAADWIWYTTPPLHLAFGTFGNVVTALVICRGYRKINSTAIFLLALAICDTLFLYSTTLRNWILFTFRLDIRGISNIGCKIGLHVTYSSIMSSSWLLVVLTAERLLCILRPHKVKIYCTKRNACIVTALVLVFIFGSNAHILYGVGNDPLPLYPGLESCMVAKEDYYVFYEYYMHWIHLAISYLFPCVFIVVGNCMIIYGIRTLSKGKGVVRKDSANSNRARRATKQRLNLTIMLVLLNVIFFISQTPLSVFLIIEPYIIEGINQVACTDFSDYRRKTEQIHLAWALTHTLAYVNASINFFLYVISGSKFRAEARALLTCKPRPHKRVFSTSSYRSSHYTDAHEDF